MERQEKIRAIKNGKFFAKGDIAVFAVCLLLVAVFTLFSFGAGKEPGSVFEVYAYGEKIATLPLDEDAYYLYTENGGKGSLARVFFEEGKSYTDGNLILVKDGKVCIEQADCPDKTCVRMGAKNSGEIICLPHGLTIKVKGGGLGGDA